MKRAFSKDTSMKMSFQILKNGRQMDQKFSSSPLAAWRSQNTFRFAPTNSNSYQAQKLLFGFSDAGNVLHYISDHFDTVNAGSKLEVPTPAKYTIDSPLSASSAQQL